MGKGRFNGRILPKRTSRLLLSFVGIAEDLKFIGRQNLSKREGEKKMNELDGMIGKKVVVETIGKKETSGILTSIETLANSIYGHSYIISIDKEVVIPMHSIYKITLMDRYEKDKKEERDKKEGREKKKSGEGLYQEVSFGLISNLDL